MVGKVGSAGGGVKSQGRFCMQRKGLTVSRKCQKSLCVGWMGASVGVKCGK
jgi:hypothetical protein